MNYTETSAITFGQVMAAIVSYSVNKSIGWAIVHGLFSWFYIIYYYVTR